MKRGAVMWYGSWKKSTKNDKKVVKGVCVFTYVYGDNCSTSSGGGEENYV